MAKYGTRVEGESAREKLAARAAPAEAAPPLPEEPAHIPVPKPAPRAPKAPKAPPSAAESAIDFLKSREGKRLARGVFGMLRKKL